MFLVLTDLHQEELKIDWINQLENEQNVDAILFLGDITNFGTCDDGVRLLRKFKHPVYFIPGNCDPPNIVREAADIVNSVHGKSFEIGGRKFAALGGSNPTIFKTPFEIPEEVIFATLDKISSKNMILMTHAPSYGILDEIPSGDHVGSKSIEKIVDMYEPLVALSGHIHESVGIKKIGKTLFMNPGPAKDGYAGILEIDGDKVLAKLIGPEN